jgi:hypothetical protein
MKGIGLAQLIYGLKFNLIADFAFQTSHVYTLSIERYKKIFPQPDLSAPPISGHKN